MRASAHMWLKRAAPPSGKLGSTPAGAPPWAPPQAVAQGWRCPLGPGKTLLASPCRLSSAVNLCPSARTNHSCGQGRVSPQGGPGALNLNQSSEGWAWGSVSRVRLCNPLVCSPVGSSVLDCLLKFAQGCLCTHRPLPPRQA